MNSTQPDLSVFNKFNFERPPVGVKFLFNKPEGIERLDKNLALCQMTREAQEKRTPFYADLENISCTPSACVLGHDISEIFESGQFGAALQVFKEARANQKIYQYLPKLAPGVVNYIAFSPLDKLTFDPDLLIILTDNTSQTEIVLRAMIYTTGEMWSSEMTNVLGCAWVFAHPFVTGKVNYITTGLSCGMKAQKVFPEGRQIISIPFNWLPTITQNLQEMPWVLPAYAADNLGEFLERLFIDLGLPPPQA